MINVAEAGLRLAEFSGGIGGVFVATNLIKLSSRIPWVNEGDTMKIRAVAGVLSAVATVLMGFADKSISVDSVQNLLVAAGMFVAIWGGAHITHVVSNKSNDNSSNQ